MSAEVRDLEFLRSIASAGSGVEVARSEISSYNEAAQQLGLCTGHKVFWKLPKAKNSRLWRGTLLVVPFMQMVCLRCVRATDARQINIEATLALATRGEPAI